MKDLIDQLILFCNTKFCSLFYFLLAQSRSQSSTPEVNVKDYSQHTEYTFIGFGKTNDQVGVSRNDKDQGMCTFTVSTRASFYLQCILKYLNFFLFLNHIVLSVLFTRVSTKFQFWLVFENLGTLLNRHSVEVQSQAEAQWISDTGCACISCLGLFLRELVNIT